jgi:hypothetical protein
VEQSVYPYPVTMTIFDVLALHAKNVEAGVENPKHYKYALLVSFQNRRFISIHRVHISPFIPAHPHQSCFETDVAFLKVNSHLLIYCNIQQFWT